MYAAVLANKSSLIFPRQCLSNCCACGSFKALIFVLFFEYDSSYDDPFIKYVQNILGIKMLLIIFLGECEFLRQYDFILFFAFSGLEFLSSHS